VRPTEAWSRHSSQLFECVGAIACAVHRGECGRIRPDDNQQCLDCGLVFVSDG